MFWVSLLIAGFMVVLGIIFSQGKGAFLIAGYNTSSKEEQDSYDTPALCRFMGKMMFLMAFCVILWGISDLIHWTPLLYIGIGLFFSVIVFMLIYANTNNRFKK